MTLPPIPFNEELRLFALARLAVLDTAREEDFDKITRLVATICDVPIALISFVDAGRQWFKSAVGLAVCETSRDTSFCAHAINHPDGVFLVEDACADSRFWDNPLVVGEPHVRFYAGVPLTTSEGFALGSLCVIDHAPRSLSSKQIAALETGARSIIGLLEHRRAHNDLRDISGPPSDVTHERGGRAAVEDTRSSKSADLPADVIDAVPGIFYLFDANGKFLLWNKRIEEITGYTADEIAATSPLGVIAPKDREHVADRIQHAFIHGTAFADAALARKDGTNIPYYFTARIVEYQGTTCVAGVGLDISERKHSEDLLKHAALHDPLTGLGNRTLLSEKLLQTAHTALRRGEQVAVLFLDLDRFKVMNDTLGHNAGDELLKAVAQRIRRSLRAEDTVVRLGGDEFVIVAEVMRSEGVTALVRNVMESFHEPFSVNDRLLHVTTSIGISVYPSDGTEPEDLLRNADAAMYRAKDLGRNTFQFFTSDMHAEAVDRLATEIDLRHGLDKGEFELYYQPVIDLRAGAAVSAEALIRWHHPTRGLVPPNEFIGIAEETGLIVPIGAWVLQEGARQARRLADLGFNECYISVNVSGRQLRDPTFLEHVRAALSESGPVANSFGIEITESSALGDPDRALAVLDECKRLGLLILLDDFGTHYSSLTYLKKFPIDVIKIDKSFVDGLPDDTDDCGIVKAVVALGQGLDCEVLAEGVESVVQATWLAENECCYATGYFYARPMPVPEFEQWLFRSRDAVAAREQMLSSVR
jgi:diguanylate cyclase (GGDEF)-like protein/PAS domain S-box-containing protein